jgi:nitrous oxide reductase accessory protein NosL
MLISTEKGGGEIVSARDDTRFYDDIACLAADWLAHRDQATAYVRLSDGVWSEAQAASYARPATVQTAMGSGLAAYSTVAEARASDRDGRVLAWDDVVRGAGERR